jgi:hypothetical protein
MALKVLLRRLGAPGLEMTGRRLRLHLSDASAVDPDRLVALVRADPAANRLTPGMELVHRIAGDEPDRLQAARSLLESLLPPDDARPPPS